MTRETTRLAFHEIAPMLPRMRKEVFLELCSRGLSTAGELAEHSLMRHAAVSARLTELREQGVVAEYGTRKCQVTKKTAIQWDVTGNKPTPRPKKQTRAQRDADEIARLKERLRRCTCGAQQRLL